MSAKPYADRLSCYHELGCLSRAAARAADVEALGEIVKDSLARNFFGPAYRWPPTPSSVTENHPLDTGMGCVISSINSVV